jgi:hypothetical protein
MRIKNKYHALRSYTKYTVFYLIGFRLIVSEDITLYCYIAYSSVEN